MEIRKLDTDKTLMQNVKQRFFALRNGMTADTLRRAGSTYRIIFGLNVPQIRQVAEAFGMPNDALAAELWANTSTRESRLMAPMLADPSRMSLSDALEWVATATAQVEELDMLCHSLLRKSAHVDALIARLSGEPESHRRYVALRLAFGRVADDPEGAADLARAEIDRHDPFTTAVARLLLAEATQIAHERS